MLGPLIFGNSILRAGRVAGGFAMVLLLAISAYFYQLVEWQDSLVEISLDALVRRQVPTSYVLSLTSLWCYGSKQSAGVQGPSSGSLGA